MPVCFHQTGSGFQTVIHNYKQTEAAPIMVENSSDPPLWNGIPPSPISSSSFALKTKMEKPHQTFPLWVPTLLAIPGFQEHDLTLNLTYLEI